MKSLTTFLEAALDLTKPIQSFTWQHKTDEVFARFDLDGIRFQMGAEFNQISLLKWKIANIEFYRVNDHNNRSYKSTNDLGPKAATVMSYMSSGIKTLLEKYPDVNILRFTAYGNSRIKMYERYFGMLMKKLNLKGMKSLPWMRDDSRVYYVAVKNATDLDKVDKFEGV